MRIFAFFFLSCTFFHFTYVFFISCTFFSFRSFFFISCMFFFISCTFLFLAHFFISCTFFHFVYVFYFVYVLVILVIPSNVSGHRVLVYTHIIVSRRSVFVFMPFHVGADVVSSSCLYRFVLLFTVLLFTVLHLHVRVSISCSHFVFELFFLFLFLFEFLLNSVNMLHDNIQNYV